MGDSAGPKVTKQLMGAETSCLETGFDVVYRDVITGSRESRDHYYDAPLIHRILKSLLPQNNTFFIATASVV